jgi:hypothetical protein
MNAPPARDRAVVEGTGIDAVGRAAGARESMKEEQEEEGDGHDSDYRGDNPFL